MRVIIEVAIIDEDMSVHNATRSGFGGAAATAADDRRARCRLTWQSSDLVK